MNKRFLVMASITALSASVLGISSYSLVSADSTSSSTKTKHTRQHVRFEARLNQAERDGTITSAQETAFKSELKTLRAERKSAISSSSTKAERQAEHTKLKNELDSWASTSNFPLSKIFPKLAS